MPLDCAGMLERAWALAMWFFLPSLANNVIFGVIGLVVCLSAVITSQNALVAFTGLFVICLNVFNFAERLKDMANITQSPGDVLDSLRALLMNPGLLKVFGCVPGWNEFEHSVG